LNNAVIGKNCLIGANALVTEGMNVPDGSLVLGSPAKLVKPLGEAALEGSRAAAQSYIDKIDLYNTHLQPLGDTAGEEHQ
jgi:carbonic anhydrase/acetyltransferase-like protein (isoleucine patch superfamily)